MNSAPRAAHHGPAELTPRKLCTPKQLRGAVPPWRKRKGRRRGRQDARHAAPGTEPSAGEGRAGPGAEGLCRLSALLALLLLLLRPSSVSASSAIPHRPDPFAPPRSAVSFPSASSGVLCGQMEPIRPVHTSHACMPYRAYICIYHSSGGLAAGRCFFVLDETIAAGAGPGALGFGRARGRPGAPFPFLCPARL